MPHLHLPFADDMKLIPKPQPGISRKWHLYVMLMLVSQKMRSSCRLFVLCFKISFGFHLIPVFRICFLLLHELLECSFPVNNVLVNKKKEKKRQCFQIAQLWTFQISQPSCTISFQTAHLTKTVKYFRWISTWKFHFD